MILSQTVEVLAETNPNRNRCAQTLTTTMGKEQRLESELPLVVQATQRKKAYIHRRRTLAVGILLGATLLVTHKHYISAPEPWLEGHLDHLGYDTSGSPTGREAEELFL